MAPVKAWYLMALGILVLTAGTSDTVRCWAGKGSQTLDELYSRGRGYVAVAHILLRNPSATEVQLQEHVARAQAVQDRLRAREDIAQAQIERAQALVEERVLRQQEFLMNKAMRPDGPLRIVRGERIVIPGRVLVGPESVTVNGHHRIAVCPSEVKVDVPDIQLPEIPSVDFTPEVPQDPI